MSLKLFTTQEKLQEVEWLIVEHQRNNQRADILKAVAADLRARLEPAPAVALIEMENRIIGISRSKGANGYAVGPLANLGELVFGRWPLIKQCLERFGAELEQKGAA